MNRREYRRLQVNPKQAEFWQSDDPAELLAVIHTSRTWPCADCPREVEFIRKVPASIPRLHRCYPGHVRWQVWQEQHRRTGGSWWDCHQYRC